MRLSICRAAGCGRTVQEPRAKQGLKTCSPRCEARYAANFKQTRKLYDQERGSSNARGYDYEWQQYRKRILNENPLCDRCMARGTPEIARHLDHVVPVRDGDSRQWFMATENHQPLCTDCHTWKTQRCDDQIRTRYNERIAAGDTVAEAMEAGRRLWEALRRT